MTSGDDPQDPSQPYLFGAALDDTKRDECGTLCRECKSRYTWFSTCWVCRAKESRDKIEERKQEAEE